MRSRIVPILRPWARAKSNRSSIRAMVPSSRMISQITPLGIEPGQPRDVDRRLGMAGADQDAAVARDQRKDMARRDDMLGPLGGVDRHRDGARAVGGADAGRDAFLRLDRGGEGGLVAGAVGPAHRLQPELVDPLLGQRQADQAAAMLGHEIDRVGRRHLGGDDEVALILAVLVVDEDEHAAVARLVDDLLRRSTSTSLGAAAEFSRACRACRRSGSSPRRRACAGYWGGGRRRGRGRPGSSRRSATMAQRRSIRMVLMTRHISHRNVIDKQEHISYALGRSSIRPR